MKVPAASSPLLLGEVSVVAGGSSGIGRAVVERLAEQGSAVEFCAVDRAGVQATETEMRDAGYDVSGRVVDASEDLAVRDFMAGVADRRGRVGVLVNSVGIQRYGTVETTPVETFDEVMAVNLRSIFLASRYAVPLMRGGGGGAIVNISSAQAIASQRNVVAYTASKGAIVAMTRAMAVDHAPDGIRVNCVCPGSVDTPMLRAAARDVDPENPDGVIAGWGALHPLGHVAEPRQIADVVLFLASPLSSFVTGAEVRADGGVLAGVALVAPGVGAGSNSRTPRGDVERSVDGPKGEG
jgi:NAD(P)-dependent dehydrogenase (short-subunit alcohol dehydrogenase family)